MFELLEAITYDDDGNPLVNAAAVEKWLVRRWSVIGSSSYYRTWRTEDMDPAQCVERMMQILSLANEMPITRGSQHHPIRGLRLLKLMLLEVLAGLQLEQIAKDRHEATNSGDVAAA